MSVLSHKSAFEHPDHYRDVTGSPLTFPLI